MKKWLCIVVCLVAVVALTGCVKGRSQSHARGVCLTWGGIGGDDGYDPSCSEQNDICFAFMYGDAMEDLTRSECFKHCADTETAQLRDHVADGCRWYVYEGRKQCDAYCFSKPEDK